MSTPSTSLKTSTSIRIDTDLLSQIRAEAKAEHRSLSNYPEALLYRPYNQATFEACESARAGAYAGTIDTHSDEAFVASILGDEPSKSFRVDR